MTGRPGPVVIHVVHLIHVIHVIHVIQVIQPTPFVPLRCGMGES